MSADDGQNDLLGGRYRLGPVLGTGQDCQVWRATDELAPERGLALKRMHAHSLGRSGLCEGTEAEWRKLLGLEIPNLMRVFEVGTADGLPYAVLQLAPGGNLEDRLRARGSRPSPEEVLGWLRTLAPALDALHRIGLVHREAAARNIHFDEKGEMLLAEFGIAKVYTEIPPPAQLTPRFGVFEHLAPEACKGIEAGPALDQYSLGVLAYRALCGRIPHQEQGAVFSLVLKRIQQPAEPLGALAPNVPAGAEAAVLRALAMEPGERFGSCLEFADAFARGLSEAAAHVPIKAVPWVPARAKASQSPETTREKARRGLRGSALAVASLLLSAAALAGSGGGGGGIPPLAVVIPACLAILCGWSSRSSFLAFLTAAGPALLVVPWNLLGPKQGWQAAVVETLALVLVFVFSAFLGVFVSALSRRLQRPS